jgi:5'-methylthioadenosine phosphorylase
MEGLFTSTQERRVKTDYGTVTAWLCTTGNSQFYALARHGRGHTVPPHRINFKANVQAMKVLGVSEVIATSAVGSISKKLAIGDLGVLDQFIDLCKRHVTFFERRPVHVDMTYPYDDALRERLIRSARSTSTNVTPGLVYVCVDGPRYETAAEIRMFGLLGGDVVGMTGAPEAILCREAGLRYASIVAATNWGAGIQEKVSHEEVVAVMESVGPRVKNIVEQAIIGV